MVIGGSAPIRAYIDAVGHATCVYVNESNPSAVAIPSLSIYNGKTSVLIVGADDEVLRSLSSVAKVHGAYHNILTPNGISALWNGYIGDAAEGNDVTSPLPSVVVNKLKVVPVDPFNLVRAPTRIVFYEKGAKKGKLADEDVVDRFRIDLPLHFINNIVCAYIGLSRSALIRKENFLAKR